MTGDLIKRGNLDTCIHRECQVGKEVGIRIKEVGAPIKGAVAPVKEHQGFSNYQELKEVWKGPPLKPSGTRGPDDTLVLNVWPPEPWENTFLLF